MAMDLTGFQPRSPRGQAFRRTIFDWHPIANYIVQEGSLEIVSKCEHWFTNDHDGLDDPASRELAAWIRARIQDGSAHHALVSAPEQLHHGHKVINALGSITGLELNPVCAGACVDDLKDFAAFLDDCGGFSID